MSRTFNEKHPTTHNKNKRFPNPKRRTRLKPHGKKYLVGYGEEVYLRKYGEIYSNLVNKNLERKLNKLDINEEYE